MATRAHVNLEPAGYGDELHLIGWEGLLNGDVGDWVEVPLHRDVSVHFFGTFGVGGTIVLEGTNEILPVPLSALVLNDTGGGTPNPISATAAKIFQVYQGVHRIRPRVTAGDANTDLVAIARATRSRG